MESLTIIPCNSTPPSPIPAKQPRRSDFYPKPTTPLAPKSRRRSISGSKLLDLCNNGRLGEAIAAIDLIAQSGSKVQYDTYNYLLDACIASGSVHLGRQLHARIGAVKGVGPFMETKLVGMYAKCGSLEDARKVFAEMRERNLFTWSAMIGACTRESRWKEAVELFHSMMREGILPDGFLLPKIVQACGNCCDLETGRLIHSLVIRKGLSSTRVNNSIISMYAKCGQLSLARKIFNSNDERDIVGWNAMISGYFQMNDIKEARRLFDAMHGEGTTPKLITWNILVANYSQLGYCDVALELVNEMKSFGITPDVFTWTSLISGFAQNDRKYQALDLFRQMLEAGVKPNGVTLASAVSASAALESLKMGLELHSFVFKLGFIHDALVGNSLIDMFSKCGELEAARWVFDMVPEKDLYTWNSMIGGYCQAGYLGIAHELVTKMRESNISPNVITWNSMISGYMQSGDEDEAMVLFLAMEKDGKVKRNTTSWNALIAGYVQNGKKNMALNIFRQMLSSGESLNTVTVLSVLPACENLIVAKKVKEIHGCVLRRNLESELSVANSLIDQYAKSGNMVYSRFIFDRMSTKDSITWNSLIAGYVLHGCSDTALDLFDQMRKFGVKRNRGTFISIVSACGRAGMVEEGKQAFSSITEEYLIAPGMEHYVAMVDLYGRSGRLGEAMELLKSMPIEPDSSVWAALLTACRIHGNLGLATLAAEQIQELEPDNLVINGLLSQLYALTGRSQDALRVGVSATQRPVGQSWIEVRNTVHSFTTGDSIQPCSHLLYSWLETISGKVEMQDNRYGYGFSIEEEEKEETGGVHSEKLAIAFALASSTRAPRSIRIVKNLRMCDGCHRTAKYVSLTYGCEIYLRDPGCFHHFKDGHCSCGDYW